MSAGGGEYMIAHGSAGAQLIGTTSAPSIYGNLNAGSIFNGALNKTTQVVLDRAQTVPATLLAADHAESFQLDVAGSTEQGLYVYCTAPSTTASGGNHSKVAVQGAVVTAALSAFPTEYQAVGVVGQGSTSGTVAQGSIIGVQGTGAVVSGTDAEAKGLVGVLINQGTAVSTVNTALSKVACQLQSAGSAKNSAFLYAFKQSAGAVAAANCSHGILIDGASVDANAFAVTSGTAPTILWAVTPTGGVKAVRADATNATVAAVTASGMCGLITYSAAASLAAVTTIDAVITNTFVNASSVVTVTPGVITVAAGSWIIPTVAAVGAGSWTLRLYNPGAATATGAAGVINVYYTVVNSN